MKIVAPSVASRPNRATSSTGIATRDDHARYLCARCRRLGSSRVTLLHISSLPSAALLFFRTWRRKPISPPSSFVRTSSPTRRNLELQASSVFTVVADIFHDYSIWIEQQRRVILFYGQSDVSEIHAFIARFRNNCQRLVKRMLFHLNPLYTPGDKNFTTVKDCSAKFRHILRRCAVTFI